MSAFRSIVHAFLLSAAALAAMPAANAQVTVHLTTVQGSNCDVTTDAQGLTLVPGGTDLRATGVTLTGTGCGTGTPPPRPSPDNFALNAPASASVGLAFPVSWTVTGATACTGSASLNGNSISLSGWTNSTSETSPRQVTATVAGIYTLSLTCSNAVGSVTSLPAIVVVSGGTSDNCPAGRQAVADICYNYNLGTGCALSTDITRFENIWGRTQPTDSPLPFPGVNGFAIIKNFDKTQGSYIAAKFTVPAGGLSPTLSGLFSHGETYPGPNLTMSISQTCGDFSPTSSICLRSNINGGGILTKYKNSAIPDGTVVACPLAPGQTYYVNIKAYNPAQTSSDCSGNICRTTVQNNFNP